MGFRKLNWGRNPFSTGCAAPLGSERGAEIQAFMENTVRVTIVGIGAIGRAWTISFLRAGCEVRIWDQFEGAVADAQKIIPTILPDLARNNLLNGRDPADVMRNMRSFSTLEEALDGAEYVQENTAENVDVKRDIFSRLDQLAIPTRSWQARPRDLCRPPSPSNCVAGIVA